MKRVTMIVAVSLLLVVSAQGGISDPGDIGGLYVRLEADSIAAADGDTVTTWTDSASGYEFAGTATYDADYANGHAAVYFNGINNMLASAGWTGGPSAGNVTLFVVANFTTMGNDSISDYMISGQYPDGTTDNRFRLIKYKDDARYQFRVGDGGTITLADTTDTEQHVFAIVSGQTGNSVSFLVDGTVLGTGNSGATPTLMQALGLGAYLNGNNQFADCSIAEVLLYNSALSNDQIGDVTDYLQTKYVPEPATMVLLGLGCLVGLRRRK